MPVWRTINRPEMGYLDGLSEDISLLEAQFPNSLAAVGDSPMWLASDYSGQHKQAAFEAYAFLVTTESSLGAWNCERVAFRRKYLADGRRLSFKKLRDRVRWRAMLPFLTIADCLQGNLVTFVIDKRIRSLFAEEGVVDWSHLPKVFPEGTSHNVVEKSLRVATFVALMIAGFRDEAQQATWISDDDDTLDTYARRDRLAELISYLTWEITGWRNPALMEFGTTALDSSHRHLEDFAAIRDLVAGALANLAPAIGIPEATGVSVSIVNRDMCTDVRTRAVIDWLACRDLPLKRILLRVVKDHAGTIRTRAEMFGFGLGPGGPG
ncbi:MAG: hypothetical protein HQ567_08845 [Candidatus Nealsonbacteria bacterium]|nr:hypothetical protein [Candidatus Nealsonbacteria bacterium]